MNIYEFTDYVDYIRAQIKANRHIRGYQSQLARAAQLHTSYLSRILSDQVHLTVDQAILLTEYWKMGADAAEFFLLLVNYARAATPNLKKFLQRRMDQLRLEQEDLANKFKDAKLDSQRDLSLYYSAWYYSAIHILLGINNFKTVSAISKRLNLSPELVESCLQSMEQLELVKKQGTSWIALNTNLHLSNRDQWASAHHAQWRVKMANQIPSKGPDELHYTGVHSIALKDFAKIKHVLNQAIEEARSLVAPSPEEEIFCLIVDWAQLR